MMMEVLAEVGGWLVSWNAMCVYLHGCVCGCVCDYHPLTFWVAGVNCLWNGEELIKAGFCVGCVLW